MNDTTLLYFILVGFFSFFMGLILGAVIDPGKLYNDDNNDDDKREVN